MTLSASDYDFGARVAASQRRPGVDLDDLKQIGRIAVWRASLEFDDSYGVPWRAWAYRWAKMAACSYCRKPMREVQMSDTLDVEAEAIDDDVELEILLPHVQELAGDARRVLVLLLCGCTARDAAWRLKWRYDDVLKLRRDALQTMREKIVERGVMHV